MDLVLIDCFGFDCEIISVEKTARHESTGRIEGDQCDAGLELPLIGRS